MGGSLAPEGHSGGSVGGCHARGRRGRRPTFAGSQALVAEVGGALGGADADARAQQHAGAQHGAEALEGGATMAARGRSRQALPTELNVTIRTIRRRGGRGLDARGAREAQCGK